MKDEFGRHLDSPSAPFRRSGTRFRNPMIRNWGVCGAGGVGLEGRVPWSEIGVGDGGGRVGG